MGKSLQLCPCNVKVICTTRCTWPFYCSCSPGNATVTTLRENRKMDSQRITNDNNPTCWKKHLQTSKMRLSESNFFLLQSSKYWMHVCFENKGKNRKDSWRIWVSFLLDNPWTKTLNHVVPHRWIIIIIIIMMKISTTWTKQTTKEKMGSRQFWSICCNETKGKKLLQSSTVPWSFHEKGSKKKLLE